MYLNILYVTIFKWGRQFKTLQEDNPIKRPNKTPLQQEKQRTRQVKATKRPHRPQCRRINPISIKSAPT